MIFLCYGIAIDEPKPKSKFCIKTIDNRGWGLHQAKPYVQKQPSWTLPPLHVSYKLIYNSLYARNASSFKTFQIQRWRRQLIAAVSIPGPLITKYRRSIDLNSFQELSSGWESLRLNSSGITPGYVTTYYDHPTQSTTQANTMVSSMTGTDSHTPSSTASSVRFASPRMTKSKST